jgi:hypothetical protein
MIEKKEKCDLIYNGHSIRVNENYEQIKNAINSGSTFLELTQDSFDSDYNYARKYLANVNHIIAIIPVLSY